MDAESSEPTGFGFLVPGLVGLARTYFRFSVVITLPPPSLFWLVTLSYVLPSLVCLSLIHI